MIYVFKYLKELFLPGSFVDLAAYAPILTSIMPKH
jgi:hypothetical protein